VPLVLRHAFRFERRLGAGGMGVVYQASDLALTRCVAIKTLPRLSPGRAERLRQEAQTMARLAHPNLATIHGAETWRGTPLLVVELLAGGTLADRLRSGPLSMAAAREVGLALADVLRHIHGEDMVHCDIKPSNIGFTGSGTLKLLDFGLARMLAADVPVPIHTAHVREPDLGTTHTPSDLSRSRALRGRFVGTPLYMAPEAIAGQNPTPQFDLWGAGVVLYETVAGHHPFAGGTTTEVLSRILGGHYVRFPALKARVTADWVDLLQCLLAPHPAARLASAGELKARVLDLKPSIASG
jgi:serine/threonine protein kinase